MLAVLVILDYKVSLADILGPEFPGDILNILNTFQNLYCSECVFEIIRIALGPVLTADNAGQSPAPGPGSPSTTR